ncbi:TrmH family RNA methyltransferase [Sphingomonas sp.]|uniref:TrmH family RNA methyltransferase n=1 Tax=Sphingomonas sp. TaxID=28214 RepID=UPI00286E782A|nr:TrmH family RNA methyltransferase [Sphingomonas sp.]
MSFWVYILRCADNSYYTGHTDDLERHIAEHQSGAIRGYTHRRRPVSLMWTQMFGTRAEALGAELQVKNWSRAKKEALFRSDWQAVSDAAKPPARRTSRLDVSAGSTSARSERDGETEKETIRVEPASSKAETRRRDSPIIVLVRPQLGQNIGKAARAMLNFGLTELRLVAPRDGWPNPTAGPAASGADLVLEQAQVFDTVADAVADCSTVFASTVRRRELAMPVIGPEEMADAIAAAPGRSAILFGPERSGLATEDVALANFIVTVPINPQFGSLNLAQAVILLAYEWSRRSALAQPPARDLEPPAPHAELEGLIAHADAELAAAGYFHPPERMQVTKNTLRTIFTKPGWSSREVKAVRGVIRALSGSRSARRKP